MPRTVAGCVLSTRTRQTPAAPISEASVPPIPSALHASQAPHTLYQRRDSIACRSQRCGVRRLGAGRARISHNLCFTAGAIMGVTTSTRLERLRYIQSADPMKKPLLLANPLPHPGRWPLCRRQGSHPRNSCRCTCADSGETFRRKIAGRTSTVCSAASGS